MREVVIFLYDQNVSHSYLKIQLVFVFIAIFGTKQILLKNFSPTFVHKFFDWQKLKKNKGSVCNSKQDRSCFTKL